MNTHGSPQLTLALRRFLGKDMAFECLGTLDASTRAHYKALGRARASMDTDGLVKILADKQTDEILGVHIIGARAADMIAAGVTAMEYRASAEDVARMSHAHPTYMEAVKEACLAATANRPLHL